MGFTPASGSGFSVNLATTGDFAVNTNQLYVDTSLGNVGIGTSSPAEPLHIQTTAAGANIYMKSTATGASGAIIKMEKSTTSYARTWWTGIGIQSTNDIGYTFYDATAAATRMFIDGSGNVGIGTTAPSARLHGISTTEQLRLGYDASNYVSHTIGSSGALSVASTGSGGSMTFTPASGSSFNVNLASGAGALASSSTAGYWNNSNGWYTVNPAQLYATNTYPGGYDAAMIWRMSDSAGTPSNSLAIGTVGTLSWTAGNVATQTADMYIAVRNTSGGISERMRITGAGNVGIGTTSPSARLHAISTTEQLRLGYDSSNYLSTTVSSAGAVTFDAVGASSGFTFSDAITLSVATPIISFKPTANNQDCGLKVLDSVGATAGYLSIVPNTIGTNSKFFMYVGGAAAADIKMTVDDDGVTNIKRDASNYCTITPSSVGLITFDAVGSGAAFTFADNVSVTNTAGDCIVTATGGTPSTTAGDGYLNLASSRTDTGVGHIVKLRSVAPSAGKADLAFLTQPSNGVYTERMRIDNAGYVGIGTTAPTSALSVVGIVKMEASSQRRPALTSSNFGYSANYRTLMLGSSSTTYNTADTGAVTLAFGVDVSANAGGTFTGNGSELLFRNATTFMTPNSGNTNYLTVMSFNDGNVGIGTSSPASLFTVNQTAVTTDGTQATYGFQLSLSGTTNLTIGANASYTYLQSWASKPLVVNSQGNNTLLNPTSGNVGIGITAPTALCHTGASTTVRASLCVPHGSAPTTPVNGDMWTTTAGLFVRINGVTKTVTLT
jgi:hypothetical protein